VTSHRAVLAALARVRDPELDEPVTDLGFVSRVSVGARAVEVRLRLPTYFCAPNFAFMMVADARREVGRVADGRDVVVLLEDHHAAEEINAGVRAGGDFRRVFAGEVDGDLGELRALFARKAFLARQYDVCEELLARGHTVQDLVSLTLGEVSPGPTLDAYLRRRRELGLDVGPGAAFLVAADGRAIPAQRVGLQLRMMRTTRVSIEGNAGLCRGLLAARYGHVREEVPAS
jgi:metal-sulfur cluster biosynthetic enzyme